MIFMETLRALNRIIERESKTSTYKFALLRGTIEIILEDSPYIQIFDDKVKLPFGPLVLKWLLYYYPLIERFGGESQIAGTSIKLSFQGQVSDLITFYNTRGGLSVLYNELKGQGIQEGARPLFLAAIKKIGDCIRKMPMVYLGTSVTGVQNGIYQYLPGPRLDTSQPYTVLWMTGMGTFTLPRAYYDTLREMGSFIGGMDSLLLKWGEFSYEATGRNHALADILAGVLERPVDERDVVDAKRIYTNLHREGKLVCAWTGLKLQSFHIDHAIPYAALKNNDLWNLLPASPAVNSSKRDKIPTANRVRNSADRILYYWSELKKALPNRFDNELQTALLGETPGPEWKDRSINRMIDLCTHLIDVRGYDLWN